MIFWLQYVVRTSATWAIPHPWAPWSPGNDNRRFGIHGNWRLRLGTKTFMLKRSIGSSMPPDRIVSSPSCQQSCQCAWRRFSKGDYRNWSSITMGNKSESIKYHTQQVSHLNNQFNRFTLLMSPPKTLITWLQTNKFLAFSMKCEQCGTDCVIYVRMYATAT